MKASNITGADGTLQITYTLDIHVSRPFLIHAGILLYSMFGDFNAVEIVLLEPKG
jgi:hypothetical protein